MPKRVSHGGGRPSKGERVRVMSRVAPGVAEALRSEAERLDLSYSDVIANALAAHYGHPPLVASSEDDQMKLTA